MQTLERQKQKPKVKVALPSSFLMAQQQLDRPMLYGPKKAGLKKAKQMAKLVNAAIDQASNEASSVVRMTFEHEQDAKDVAAYINSESKGIYEAKVSHREIPQWNIPENLDDKLKAVLAILSNVAAQVITRKNSDKFQVTFVIPEVALPDLIAYEERVKKEDEEREQKMNEMRKEREHARDPRSFGYNFGGGQEMATALCVNSTDAE